MIDNDDGTYCVSYIPKLRGNHAIHVTLRDKHIKGSPFTIMVSGRIDYHRLHHTTRAFGSQGEGGGEFNMPWGVAVDNEREYVIVTDTGNHRVQVMVLKFHFIHLSSSCLVAHRAGTQLPHSVRRLRPHLLPCSPPRLASFPSPPSPPSCLWLPLFLFPSGTQVSAILQSLSLSRLSTWPIIFHRLLFTSQLNGSMPACLIFRK